jgi:hypothetical protein
MAKSKKTLEKQANQYVLDPRQSLFYNYYFNPKEETFSNALQSALKAGYAQEYAENITALMPTWLSEAIGERSMLHKAEKNLNEMLDLDGEDPNKLRVKADITKFVAERIGKKKYGKEDGGGNKTEINIFAGEQIKRIAGRVLNGESESEREPN